METPQHNILIVDDEETLCEILSFNLRAAGYQTSVAYSAEEALTLPLEQFDLLLLDVMMGELSGFGFANILKGRPQTADIPIIFCTARDSEDDTVRGLGLGADDYISKPFSVREVVARVGSVLRRTAPIRTERNLLSFNGLNLDLQRKVCTVDGEEVALTRKEFQILALLLEHPDMVFSREEIMDRVWKDDVVVMGRTVDVNVTRLRKKIGPYGANIITRLGHGYGFTKEIDL